MVSIVIPAYNEEKYIGQCLESLIEQDTVSSYEVIVVDNNSTDQTVEIAQNFKDKLNLKILHEQKQGRGAARARGFDVAQGWIILSTDADAIVYPDWVDTLVAGVDGQVVATTTSCKILDLGFLRNTLFNFVQPTATYLYRLIFGHYWLAGFSFAILKSVYSQAGGFNIHLQALEDADLAFRVAKLGKIKFINKPVIFSGRRFKDNLFAGLWQYVNIFVQGYILKKEKIYMSNIR